MADAIKAFLEFLIDLFSALATFLGGDAEFDFTAVINNFLNGGEGETDGEAEGK